MEERISHVRYLSIRLQEFTNANSVGKAAELTNSSIRSIKRFIGGDRMSMQTVQNLSDILGVSVSELMLPPGDEDKTEWYKDSKIEYLCSNLNTYANEQGLSSVDVARIIGVAKSTAEKYFKGKIIPMSDNLQLLADALNVEVADLSLPPDGI